ncbi:MAG: ATP-binding protein [Fuerstiella sp.]|nr:GHKL domain-containing protein [Fuerstiella sp.]
MAQEALLDHQRRETELAEARLAKLSQQLVHQTRLATIGQMTASIAHEIRNPLGAVRNAAYYLKRHVPRDKPKFSQYLDIIDQEVHAADHVIRDMLQMACSKDPDVESFDLSLTIREVFDRMNAGAAVRFDLVSHPDPFMIMADPGQCRQVIFNLVTNAVHAVDGNGEIRVEIRREEDHDLITVQDDGPGVDAEHGDRLFEPLFSTKAKGTGLGLAICREIIERHGGTIELQQNNGTGALFCIKLRRHGAED